MLRALPFEGNNVEDAKENVDCCDTKRRLTRQSRSSSVTSITTAETCSSSIYSSCRSLTITTVKNEAKCRKRRVHFDETTEEYSPALHGRHVDIQDLWYTENDYKLFRSVAQKEGSMYRQSARVVRNIQAVYEVRSNLLQATLASHASCEENMTLEKAVHVLGSGVRGLEVSILKQLSKDRRAVLKGVLDMQAKLPGGLSANEQTIAIAAKARFLSRQFRQFALVQGKADAITLSNLEDGEEEIC